MPDSDENLPLSPSDTQATENRMRRALGLQGQTRQPPQQRADQVRPRHRFVQDGGVPVVVLNSRSDNDPTALFKARVSELEAALEAERTAHSATRRVLHEAQAGVQAQQTRLAHSELAHSEALAAERSARQAAEEALQARLAESEQPASLTVAAPPLPAVAKAKPAARKASRAPRVSNAKEPQPVKWWLPSFREKLRS